MSYELKGSPKLLAMLFHQLSEAVDDHNLDEHIDRLLKGDTAISKLIDAKCEELMPDEYYEKDALFHFSAQNALQAIKAEANGSEGGYGRVMAIEHEEILNEIVREADDQLLIDCWRDHSLERDWYCQKEALIDTSDGLKMREQRWLISNTQKVAFDIVQSSIVDALISFIENDIHWFTKHLYLKVSLDEWVAAYNADSGKENDPKEIQERIQKVLM